MSRYDYRDPGTDPAYCDPLRAEDDLEDIDVPDFTAPEDPEGLTPGQRALANDLDRIIDILDPPIDPAEHACHAIISALSTLEKEIVTAADLARARTLRRMVRDLWQHVTDVTDRAANKEDELVERLR